MEAQSLVALIGAIGLISLALSWHFRGGNSVKLAQLGWILVGIYFFFGAWKYQEKGDLLLTMMSLIALPLTIGLAYW